MSKRQKLINKWKNNTPTTAKRREVEGILNIYFPGEYALEKSSHIVVDSEKLKFLKSAPLGILTIPLTNGRHVKGRYLKDLMRVIEEIEQLEG